MWMGGEHIYLYASEEKDRGGSGVGTCPQGSGTACIAARGGAWLSIS